MTNLLIFGAGFSARQSAVVAKSQYERIWGTTRSTEKAEGLRSAGISPIVFDGEPSGELSDAIARADHILISTAPDDTGDPVLGSCRDLLESSECLRWICYFSTVGVYGDSGGGWVDEDTPCQPGSRRSIWRLAAERAWRDLAEARGIGLAIFRLSGIYGPGRNTFINIEKGRSRRIIKPGQVFNRIHRDDIARAFALAAAGECDGIFNITDDLPAPPQDLVELAHELHGSPPPPAIDFDEADMSPMARSFYSDNKRVSNAKSNEVLGMTYEYPDFRTALERMWREGTWKTEEG